MVVSSTSLICGATRSPVIAASRPDPSAACAPRPARPSLSRVRRGLRRPESRAPRRGPREARRRGRAGEALRQLVDALAPPRLTNIARAPPLAGSSIPERRPSSARGPCSLIGNSRRGPGPVSNLSCHVQMREGTEGVLKLLILSLFIHYSRIQCARLCIAAPAGSALTKLPGCRAPYPPPPPFSSSSPARSCHCTTLPSHPTVASIGR